ncbi:acylphosphatase [Patescibacteria group bacterium]|nr:acylphosphatase [Patescibacteria group bacterium]
MQKRARINVFGDVQGVFFRADAKARAQELGLTGWVKNEPDRTVRILAEGAEDQIKEFIDWCKNSPGFAKTDKVEVKWEEVKGEFNSFDIREEIIKIIS